MTTRVTPAQPPYSAATQAWFDRTMPKGMPPLVLFTTLARDERLFGKFAAGGLLDRGHLSLRQRELVIDRTTALCGSEYEWGVHVALFGPRVGLDQRQVHALVHGGSDDPCWTAAEQKLLRLCDTLHRDCSVDDALWQSLREDFSEEAMLELLLLAGAYRTISYLSNALQLPLEPSAARFPRAATPSAASDA